MAIANHTGMAVPGTAVRILAQQFLKLCFHSLMDQLLRTRAQQICQGIENNISTSKF